MDSDEFAELYVEALIEATRKNLKPFGKEIQKWAEKARELEKEWENFLQKQSDNNT